MYGYFVGFSWVLILPQVLNCVILIRFASEELVLIVNWSQEVLSGISEKAKEWVRGFISISKKDLKRLSIIEVGNFKK